MNRIIGKCSLCGGDVTLPEVWMGVKPPVPTCEKCGAVEDSNKPVIPMKRAYRGDSPIRKDWNYAKWMVLLAVLCLGCSQEPPESQIFKTYFLRKIGNIQNDVKDSPTSLYTIKLDGKDYYVTISSLFRGSAYYSIGPEVIYSKPDGD